MATAYAIAGWLIIQIATSVFPVFNFPDWTSQFVIILVGIGFPISVIIAWAFELTADGLKKTDEVETETSITPQTGKKINKVIITVLSMALVFVLIERVFFAQTGMIEDPGLEMHAASIAVLPFVNMSSDQENEYFSDGLSEELLNGLAKIEGMQVAGRTSSFQFKGQTPDFKEVGELLKVQHVLEGSVRKSGNRVRITAQLIQAENGYHLWSETYDRELTATDIFDIQEEITRKVVSELKVRLLPEEEVAISTNPTEDIEAYNAFLEATQVEVSRQPDDLAHAVRKYKEAISIDPTFSLAYARLAYTYNLMNSYGNLPFEETKKLMRDNIDQALLLNSNQGKAYQALAMYFRDFESDFDKAEEAARKAVELLPSDAMAHNSLQIALDKNEKQDESNEILKRAYELDPLNNIVASNYAGYLVSEQRFDEALKLINQILERYPDYTRGLQLKANMLSNMPYGQLDEAFKLVFKAYHNNRDDYSLLIALRIRARDLDMFTLADFYEAKLRELYPENVTVQFFEYFNYLEREEYEKALDFIEAYKEKIGDEDGEATWGNFASIYSELGRYDEAVELYLKYNEILKERPIVLERYTFVKISGFAQLLKEADRDDEAQVFVEAVCEYAAENQKNPPKELTDFEIYMQDLTCKILNEDYDPLISALDDYFFNKKFKSGFANRDGTVDFPDEMTEKPEFQKLEKRIYEDLHRMRDNVIEYLKAEGEWKEEWGEGNSE